MFDNLIQAVPTRKIEIDNGFNVYWQDNINSLEEVANINNSLRDNLSEFRSYIISISDENLRQLEAERITRDLLYAYYDATLAEDENPDKFYIGAITILLNRVLGLVPTILCELKIGYSTIFFDNIINSREYGKEDDELKPPFNGNVISEESLASAIMDKNNYPKFDKRHEDFRIRVSLLKRYHNENLSDALKEVRDDKEIYKLPEKDWPLSILRTPVKDENSNRFSRKRHDDEMKYVFTQLVGKKFIQGSTIESHFLYWFGCFNEKPTDLAPIKWTAKNIKTGYPSKKSLLDLLVLIGYQEQEIRDKINEVFVIDGGKEFKAQDYTPYKDWSKIKSEYHAELEEIVNKIKNFFST